MRPIDLTSEEQANVRAALRYLRTRCGGWKPLAKAIGMSEVTVRLANSGHNRVSATMAFGVARIAGVAVDDVLVGNYPAPGTCPHCGQPRQDFIEEDTAAS